MKHTQYLFTIMVFLLMTSCLKKREELAWNTKILTPIAKSELGIQNLVADTLYRVESDSTLTVVYQQNLGDLRIDSLVPFSGKEYIERVKISEFPISTRDIEYNLIARDLIQNLPLLARLVLEQNDDQVVVIPPYPNISSPPDTLNADDVFTSADIIEGYLVNTVTNNLSVPLANITYTIKNQNDGTVIGNGFIDRIDPGQTVSDSISLDGKRVEGKLIYQVTNVDIVGSNGEPVLFDLDKGLFIRVLASNLKARTMTAVFPKQEFIRDTFDTELNGIGDKLLTRVKIKSGKVQVKYISTSPDTVFFTYKIWDAKINGTDTFKLSAKFKPGSLNSPAEGIIEKEINDFDLDLLLETPEGDVPNRFKSSLLAGFDSTGRLVTITENDSIRMEIRLLDIQPSYAKGYFGKDTFNIGPLDSDFEVFKNFKDGILSFENVKLTLDVSSGAGLAAKVDIVKIEGLNTRTGVRVPLHIDQPTFNIPAAIEDPFTVSRVTYTLDNSTAGITEFLENMPDKLFYEAAVETNPDANPNDVSTMPMTNFLTDQSNFGIDLNVEIPLSIKATNLTLADTTYMTAFNLENIEKINDGTLSLLFENEMPLAINIKLYVVDQSDVLVDSLVAPGPVLAANLDPVTGKVISANKQKIDYYFDTERLRTLLSSKKIYFKVILDTSSDKYHKLYASNKVKVNLVGKFNYLISTK